MKLSILLFGIIILCAGAVIASHTETLELPNPDYPKWSNDPTVSMMTRPFWIPGAIVCLIGIVTIFIGVSMPSGEQAKPKDVWEELLKE